MSRILRYSKAFRYGNLLDWRPGRLRQCRLFLASGALLALSGCPKPPTLGAPPSAAAGPAEQRLASRSERLGSLRADAVIRMRIPPGMDGAPGGKVRAIVLAASRPDRARLEILTPLGTPGATLLLAEGELQVYQPIQNTLLKGPIDSPEMESRSPLPVPLSALPALLRGAVPLEEGEVTERESGGGGIVGGIIGGSAGVVSDAAAGEEASASRGGQILDVHRDGRLVQRVRVDSTGGYPLEDVHFDSAGEPSLTVRYLDYGAVETPAGPVAFPQRVEASVRRPEGTASMDVKLSGITIDPDLASGAFTLDFDPQRRPRIEAFE